jgi:hypothetical protein
MLFDLSFRVGFESGRETINRTLKTSHLSHLDIPPQFHHLPGKAALTFSSILDKSRRYSIKDNIR